MISEFLHHRLSTASCIFLKVLLILLIYGAEIVPGWSQEVTVSGARIGGDDLRTRFVLDLSRKVEFQLSQSEDSQQLQILLPQGQFSLEEGAGQTSRGLIKGFRYGTANGGQSRVIIDMLRPVAIASSELIEGKRKKPSRLVIDLEPAQVAAPAENETSNLPVQARTIVLDAGHGGIDPGAISLNKHYEKDIVFAFVKDLSTALTATGRYRVVLTRDTDKFVSLPERVRIARAAKADLFIAIHADTFRGRTARGTTLYTLSEKASDAEAEAYARKENRADAVAGMDLPPETDTVADVLFDLIQRESKGQSVIFSQLAVGELGKVTLVAPKPVRSAGFVVLKAPDVPSVLVELGYLSSAEDEKLLLDENWRKNTAAAMLKAIDSHFDAVDLTTSSTDNPASPSP
jgi:N-acetylmuramoyl-L-alanine amidase